MSLLKQGIGMGVAVAEKILMEKGSCYLEAFCITYLACRAKKLGVKIYIQPKKRYHHAWFVVNKINIHMEGMEFVWVSS